MLDVAERGRTDDVADLHHCRCCLMRTVRVEVLSQGCVREKQSEPHSARRGFHPAASVALELAKRLGVRWAIGRFAGVWPSSRCAVCVSPARRDRLPRTSGIEVVHLLESEVPRFALSFVFFAFYLKGFSAI